jgi:hypothetical protein
LTVARSRGRRLPLRLNSDIHSAHVDEWVGNSVPVLLATYARCRSAQMRELQRRIEAAQDIFGPATDPRGRG